MPRRTAAHALNIHVGAGIATQAAALVIKHGATRAFVLYDTKVAAPAKRIARDLRCESLGLRVSEDKKTLATAESIYTALLKAGLDRKSFVVAVGGGVVTDLAGFVAGTFLRGIPWGAVPTTLLAQVDAAIGGKTAVNHPLGKNLVGVFHQPSFVLCDTTLLSTLPAREWASGLGEMVKYGIAFDASLHRLLVARIGELRENRKLLADVVTRCVAWKARIVAEDERETKGRRRLLNFGHTLGHAFEAATGYRYFRHGEAVILGMRVATALSVERGLLAERTAADIDAFLATLPCPAVPRLRPAALLGYVARDKKKEGATVPFILLDRTGHAVVDRGVTPAMIRNALASARDGAGH